MATSLVALGCTDEPYNPGTGDDASWSTLIEASWSIPEGEESYTCARLTVENDTWVRAFRAVAPKGTHHTVLSVDATGGSDGTFPCNAALNGQNMLFGSGVGTEPVEFPEGVAIKLDRGSALLLNLHLYNVSTEPLDGLSGIEVQTVDPSEVVHEAEIVLAGTIDIQAPPGASMTTGSCVMSHDVTLFALFPHMHQIGTHLKATAKPISGTADVLLDAPYSFESQVYYDVSPELSLKKGDSIEVECHYENPGTETVTFGDSSLDEMCFVGLYRYPKNASSGVVCATGSTPNLPPCAEPGAPGNEIGVGRHCTKGGAECAQTASICLADYDESAFANFCTRLCTTTADCATGATCIGDPKVCVPNECIGN